MNVYYCNIGCEVFNGGMQNLIDFCLKRNSYQENLGIYWNSDEPTIFAPYMEAGAVLKIFYVLMSEIFVTTFAW